MVEGAGAAAPSAGAPFATMDAAPLSSRPSQQLPADFAEDGWTSAEDHFAAAAAAPQTAEAAAHHGRAPHHHAHDLTAKIGAAHSFDANIYAERRAANAALAEAGRAKARGTGPPFATAAAGEFDSLRRRDYYVPKARRDGALGDGGGGAAGLGKQYSAKDFDPAPYSEQLRANLENQAESLKRSSVGSGAILRHGAAS